VGRNKWLSIQIDSDRKFESTPRFRGTGDPGKIFYENSLPSRDPRGARARGGDEATTFTAVEHLRQAP